MVSCLEYLSRDELIKHVSWPHAYSRGEIGNLITFLHRMMLISRKLSVSLCSWLSNLMQGVISFIEMCSSFALNN